MHVMLRDMSLMGMHLISVDHVKTLAMAWMELVDALYAMLSKAALRRLAVSGVHTSPSSQGMSADVTRVVSLMT